MYEKDCRWSLSLRLLAVAAAAAGIAACTRGRNGNDVWARVDGAPIYRAQVEAAFRARESSLAGNSRPEQQLSFKLAILNQLIDRRLLLNQAAQLQVKVQAKELDERMSQICGAYSGDGFQTMLAARGITAADFRRQVRDDLVLTQLIHEKIGSAVQVTPGEITAYYNRHKAEFTVPQDEYHLAQILVTPRPDPIVTNLMHDDARNESEARRKIAALYSQVRAGKDFSKVAEDYSEDPRTAPEGGDMGFVPTSAFASNPQLNRILEGLRPGQLSGIVHDKSSYRIFRMLGRRSAGQLPLSDPAVESSIRKTLVSEKEELLKAAYIESLRNRAHVEDYLAEQIVAHHGSSAGLE